MTGGSRALSFARLLPCSLVKDIGFPITPSRVTSGMGMAKAEPKPYSILVIPDAQVKPGVDLSHMDWIGRYIADKQPSTVVCIGDFADMPSLSSYDRGKRSFAGRTYADDVQSVHRAMKMLMDPFRKIKGYKPRLVMTLGNHEDRITRAIEEDGRLFGTISLEDLGYKEAGWEVYPFLEVVMIEGVAFSHYFTSGVMGRPVTTARALVKARHCSAVMGHVQTSDAYLGDQRADGRHITGLFCGTAYLHEEPYLGRQGNAQRRQVVMLNDVRDGELDLCFVSLEFLRRKYGRKAA
jgi:hypothetical protein